VNTRALSARVGLGGSTRPVLCHPRALTRGPAKRRANTAVMAAVGIPAIFENVQTLTETVFRTVLMTVGTHLFGVMRQVVQAVDKVINDPWRPEEVWVLMLYFACLRPLLYNLYYAVQTLRGLRSKICEQNFKESFFGFLHEPLRLLGVAMSVNWLADSAVVALQSQAGEVSPLVLALGKCDAASYIVVFGYFMYKLQDYYLDEFLDVCIGKDKVETGIQDLVHRFLEVIIIFSTLLSALQTFGASASIITGLYSLLGIGFGFASQEVLQNFFGGLMLVIMRPFQVGDNIVMTNPQREGEVLEGLVYNIGYYQTILLDENDNPTFVPNQWFVSVEITNKSRTREYFSNLRSYQAAALSKGGPTTSSEKK